MWIYNCVMLKSPAMYLTDRFREWEQETGRRQSVSSYARTLKVSNESLARWMRGDGVPDYANTAQLARTYGIEVYEIMGYDAPSDFHAELQKAQSAFDALPPEGQKALMDSINQIIEDTIREYGGRRIK